MIANIPQTAARDENRWEVLGNTHRGQWINPRIGRRACVSGLMDDYVNLSSWNHFTNDLWAKTFDIVNIHYLVIMIIMTQSGHKCTHVWQLSCQGICKIVTRSDHNFSHKSNIFFFKIWIMSSENVCEMCFCSLVQSIFKSIKNIASVPTKYLRSTCLEKRSHTSLFCTYNRWSISIILLQWN